MIDVPSLVGGGGSNWRTHRAQQQRPPSPALPHKGGGSRPSLPRELIPLIGIRTERAPACSMTKTMLGADRPQVIRPAPDASQLPLHGPGSPARLPPL